MAVKTGPVPKTGPTVKAPNSTQAVRARLEATEKNVKRVQANRTPTPLLLHQLANAGPMTKVADQQFIQYDAASGKFVPSFVDKMQNAYDSAFIEIGSNGSITIEADQVIEIISGGCGPMIISAPGITVNATATFFGLAVNFEATFAGQTNFESTVNMTDLPTSNPHRIGQLWNNAGVVSVSSG